MSSAFLKNETAEAPVLIPARAPLPAGTPNYVTPKGLELLRLECQELETQRAHLQSDPSEDDSQRSRQLALVQGCLAQLNQRIATAKVVDSQPSGQVRFGASVILTAKAGLMAVSERRLRIVGVDEANAAQGLIAFTAPLAQALQGKRVGERVMSPSAQGPQEMELVSIRYEGG